MRGGAAVVFDGDDTLWLVEQLYDDARRAAAAVVESVGLNAARWEALEREIDVRNVAHMGVGTERFPASCVEAYAAVAGEAGLALDSAVAERVRLVAAQVFRSEAPAVIGASAVVEWVRSRYAAVLLTKGEPTVQRARIAQVGLEGAFDLIAIVSSKGPAEFRQVLLEVGAEPADSWSVGNSLPSDINPALSIGMSAIWIDAHVWEHERRETEPELGHLVVARQLGDVPSLLEEEMVRTRGCIPMAQ